MVFSGIVENLEYRVCHSVSAFDVINVPEEQQDFSIRGNGINVAVIDSGADMSQNYIKGGVNLIDPTVPPSDGFGHGNFIAAEIHQVAPQAGIYAIKVLNDQGTAPDGKIEQGIQWVIDHYQQYGISIVNFSIGYFQDDSTIDTEFETLAKDGVTVCVAAGNSQASHPNVLNAAANCPDVISVGATWTQFLVNVNFDGAVDYQTQTDKIAAYSNRSDRLSILAPGDIHIDNLKDWTGTSMSTGLVSGAAALIKEALVAKGLPSDEASILKVMQETGKPIFDGATPLDNVEHTGDTFERLDVDAAIQSIFPTKKTPAVANNTTFVTSLYEHVLNRKPDQQGLTYWVSSNFSHQQIVDMIWNSEEHRKNYVEQSVEQLYWSLLGRNGDTGGLSYFSGKPEDFVAETMLASPEFFARSVDAD